MNDELPCLELLEATPAILRGLASRGLSPVTLTDLLSP